MNESAFRQRRVEPWRGWIRAEAFLKATGLTSDHLSFLVEEGRLQYVFDASGKKVGFFDDSPPTFDELHALGLPVRSDFDPERLRSFGVRGDGPASEPLVENGVSDDAAKRSASEATPNDVHVTVELSQFLVASGLSVTDVQQLNGSGRLPLMFDADGNPSLIFESDLPTAADLREYGFEVPSDYAVDQVRSSSTAKSGGGELSGTWSMGHGDLGSDE